MLAAAPPLLPHENPHEFSTLQTAWTHDLPGSSFALQTLREDLIRADWQRRRARSLFDQLQLDLHLTGLPMPYWDRLTRQQFRFLEKHAAHAQQEFRKAFQLAHSFKPAPAKAEPPPPPPPEPKRDYRPVFQQCILVSVVDGKTVTKDNFPAHSFLRPEVLSKAAGMWRHFNFENAVVPPEYAHLMQHNGIDYGPADRIFISYQTEDYKEICEREIAANSPHLLDGPRWGYAHFFKYKKSVGRPASEDPAAEI